MTDMEKWKVVRLFTKVCADRGMFGDDAAGIFMAQWHWDQKRFVKRLDEYVKLYINRTEKDLKYIKGFNEGIKNMFKTKEVRDEKEKTRA